MEGTMGAPAVSWIMINAGLANSVDVRQGVQSKDKHTVTQLEAFVDICLVATSLIATAKRRALIFQACFDH